MNQFPSLSTMLSTYASVTTSLMLLHSILYQFLPPAARAYLTALLHRVWAPNSTLTLSFKHKSGLSENQVFHAAQLYLATIISPKTKHLSVSKILREKALTVTLEPGEKLVDTFQGAQVTWFFVEEEENKKGDTSSNNAGSGSVGLYKLCFNKKFKDLVLDSYIPYVLGRSVEIKNSQRALKIHSLGSCSSSYWVWWNSVVFEHPSTFQTLAMQPSVKKGIMEDLERFVRRKEFYRRAGRAWKRGYLLYGPPGTGKSSLIAAMANYLKFDVYDLQLANLTSDHQLRSLMLKTANRSILVIEDIDCSMALPTRDDPLTNTTSPTPTPTPTHSPTQKKPKRDSQVTLSGLLNFIDGLWSSCGDERIIIFTTNHKEKLDPALLRPGRMDVHVHMSYCTFECFKILANNYMEIPESYDHHLYKEIEELFGLAEVTPAQVAEELMKSEDIDVALESLLKLLKDKKIEAEEKKKKEEEEESKAKKDEDSKAKKKKEDEESKNTEKLKEEESKAEKLKEEVSKSAEKLEEEESKAEKLKEEAARDEIYLS